VSLSEEISYRVLASEADFEQCLELQRATWGNDFRELVPPTILRIALKVGGIAEGAFASGDRLVGFVFGLSGIRRGRIAHWSHMLAVYEEARGLGVGRRLKERQRDLLLRLGCEVVYWTYDPLVARNANLNLCRLGAVPEEYVRDMYGADTGSALHSGLGTDRFVVSWEIASPRVVAALESSGVEAQPPPRSESLLAATDLATGNPLDAPRAVEELLAASEFYVEIPGDIELLKAAAIEEARRWRTATRFALETGLAHGFRVAGLASGAAAGASGQRWFYRLVRAEEARS
jgi:predicted GNAT superfamily acetyltransferase